MDETPAVKPALTGGCQCGAVRYAVHAKPEGTHFCHCRMCQKAVGNVFAALVPVPTASVVWTHGVPSYFASSSVAERGFCACCGTPLVFRYVDSPMIDLTLGSLDAPAQTPIERHYGIEQKVPWLHLADALPQDSTDESMETDRKARLVNYQHPDHDTPADWTPST